VVFGCGNISPGTKADSAPVVYSISVTGQRGPGRSILVSGRTNLPEGLILQPLVKTAADSSFRTIGPKIVLGSDGTFTWRARTGQAVSIAFTSEGRSVKSNVLRVPAS